MRKTLIALCLIAAVGCKGDKSENSDASAKPKAPKVVVVGPNTTRKDIPRDDPEGRFVDRILDELDPSGKNWSNQERRFRYDLNGDKRDEQLLLISGKVWCPDGRCTLLIMTLGDDKKDQEPTLVARLEIGDGPVMVSETAHQKWHDLFTTHPSKPDKSFIRWAFNGKTYVRSPDPVDMKNLGAGIRVFENAGTAPDPPNVMPVRPGVIYQVPNPDGKTPATPPGAKPAGPVAGPVAAPAAEPATKAATKKR